jgi:5'(3')-deoxyribonucleotidase
MSKRQLGVDVDGVVVDTLNLYKQASKHLEDPLDFWRDETLYDNLVPMERAVEKLKSLSQYFDIVFVSRLKGNHHRSKVYWLKKHFPFMTGFVGTHEKWILNASLVAMIDDLEDNLVKFDPQKRVLFGGKDLPNWNSLDVAKFCKEFI